MNKKKALLHHYRVQARRALNQPQHQLSRVETLRDLNATNDVIAVDHNAIPQYINEARIQVATKLIPKEATDANTRMRLLDYADGKTCFIIGIVTDIRLKYSKFKDNQIMVLLSKPQIIHSNSLIYHKDDTMELFDSHIWVSVNDASFISPNIRYLSVGDMLGIHCKIGSYRGHIEDGHYGYKLGIKQPQFDVGGYMFLKQSKVHPGELCANGIRNDYPRKGDWILCFEDDYEQPRRKHVFIKPSTYTQSCYTSAYLQTNYDDLLKKQRTTLLPKEKKTAAPYLTAYQEKRHKSHDGLYALTLLMTQPSNTTFIRDSWQTICHANY